MATHARFEAAWCASMFHIMCSRITYLEWQHEVILAEVQLLRNAVVGFALAEEGAAHAGHVRSAESATGPDASGSVKSAESATGPDASQTVEVLAAVAYYVQREVELADMTDGRDGPVRLENSTQIAAVYAALYDENEDCHVPERKTKIKRAMRAVRDFLVLHMFVSPGVGGEQRGSSASSMLRDVFPASMGSKKTTRSTPRSCCHSRP